MTHKELVLRPYELMLVFQPDLLESALEKKLKEFDKFIEESHGKVDMRDNWGKRKLAYKIGKFDSAIYVVYNLTLPTTFNRELDEHMRIDKDIIRFLQTALPEDYTYTKFEEEVKAEVKAEKPVTNRQQATTHRAPSKEKAPAEIKDKGKKADAGSLDDKLDKLLEGGDLNI